MSKKIDFSKYDYKNTKEYKFHQRAMAEFRALSPEEKRQTLVNAGILHPETFKLTRRYGGAAPNVDDKDSQ